MKKILLILTLLGISLCSFAQEQKDILNISFSKDIRNLQTASNLAKYGYENYSASALIEAARIFSSIPVQKLEIAVQHGNAEVEIDKGVHVFFEPTQLLLDAKKYVGKNKVLLSLIKQTERSLKESSLRGAMAGPKFRKDCVGCMDYNVYEICFVKDDLAEVYISGDGDTDLDLYVYDENGNEIGVDDNYTDDCIVCWFPKWTGDFIIKVVNQGQVANNYVLWTN